MNKEVNVWVEKIMIPTYAVGKAEKNPIFLEKRVYQGSSGVVYPMPVVEKIEDEKMDREYTAVFIENEYLKIMVLPELGGRIQRAYDKVIQRDFIYYNQVIKPALVGLAGPWISGGIEFNWPQHHRPSTFSEVDFTLEDHADGSKTIWVNEIEIMSRTKGKIGFTLYPGKAFLEVKGAVFNRTPFPQTFLWWANPALKVNEYTQSVFPPDVHAVFDHGKRDVSDFPIATGVYYKKDYAPGTDISWYKNIPVPTSYMAIHSEYDFIGCYEHDTEAGMLHIANHQVSPGKKQWTWGNGDFGQAWDKNLTDEDGPYIELMCGVFTDNQPDFSWLQPNEQKTFEQYFLPYSKIGLVSNATRDAAISVHTEAQTVEIKIYATSVFAGAYMEIYQDKRLLKDKLIFDISPDKVYKYSCQLPLSTTINDPSLSIDVFDNQGHLLVSFNKREEFHRELPPPAQAAKLPADITTNELLYLNGLHLEQYRHATYSPVDYYEEALRRDKNDSRCNNAMGLLMMRKGKYIQAATYFSTALETILSRNPNPYDGEIFYNYGICLSFLNRNKEAIDAIYKSTWNDAFQHSGFLQLSRLESRLKNYPEALKLVEKSLLKNTESTSARHLRVVFLRKNGCTEKALQSIADALQLDPFNIGCLFEQYLIYTDIAGSTASVEAYNKFREIMRNSFNNYIEAAYDYSNAGLFEEAIDLISIYEKDNLLFDINPLLYYFKAWALRQIDELQGSADYIYKASQAKPDYCFPSKLEDVAILLSAIEHYPEEPKAYYYLGNFWYANRQYNDAIECWRKSLTIDDRFPTAHRNLSLAYYNKLKNVRESIEHLEMAFNLDPSDARVLMELDQLYKLQNVSVENRLKLLELHLPLVEWRDDLYLERVALYNQSGKYAIAMMLLEARKFHPWEGGEGKVVGEYLRCHIALAQEDIYTEDYLGALQLLAMTDKYPDNLGEGKLPGTQENDIDFLKGCAHAGLEAPELAELYFTKASAGLSEPVQAIFYNDPQPDQLFYQGLAFIKLGQAAKATSIFQRLIDFGLQHQDDNITIDYFAVSLPDLLVFDQDLDVKNAIHCEYMMALGWLGLAQYDKAMAGFDKVLSMNVHHQGAMRHKNMKNFLQEMFAGAEVR